MGFWSALTGGGISSVLDSTTSLVDEFSTEKEAIALKSEIAKHSVDVAKEVIKINLIDAASKNMFQAGWRPFLGWCGGCVFIFTVVSPPIWDMCHGRPPLVDSRSALELLGLLLGVAVMRTVDKIKGVSA